ncbi:MAG: hypothetical protein JXQ73_07115, partial [Phycisphaerae bacterium]|nr:hypothetical protein [Phycisphaerae bacterium]
MSGTTDVLRAAFAVSFFILTVIAQEKTEVTVQTGKVKVQTPSATTTIAPGQKAILTSGESIKVGAENPLVKDLLELDRWAQEERQAKRIPICGHQILASYVDSDRLWTQAVILEVPNRESSPTSTCRIGATTILQNPAFYDMDGRELPFELKPVNKRTGYYFLHFPKPVPAGEEFKLIGVSGYETDHDTMWQEGKVWYVWTCNGSRNSLNYFRFVLPKSAIFIDACPRPVAIDQVDGRTAVTMRRYYNGKGHADGTVAFLWPERDGSTLADVPPRYRGLPNERDAALAQEYEREMDKIRSGVKYCDQSTPVRALLTWCCGLVQRDKALYINASVDSLTKDSMKRERLDADVAVWSTRTKADERWRRLCSHFVDGVTFLSTPPWPDAPASGYLHPVSVSRPGSMMRDHMHAFVYVDGKWYRVGNTGRRSMTNPNDFRKYLPADVPPPPDNAEELLTRSGCGRGSNENIAKAYSEEWLANLEPRSLYKAGLALYDVKR